MNFIVWISIDARRDTDFCERFLLILLVLTYFVIIFRLNEILLLIQITAIAF